MSSDDPVAHRPVVLVGAGRWGSAHARQWSRICSQAPLVIIDHDYQRSKSLAHTYQAQSCSTFSEAMDQLSGLPRPLICVVTPVESLDHVAHEASRWSDLMLIEKPGVSVPLSARGAVGYIERFNPIQSQLATAMRYATSAGSLIQVDTCRLSQYAPTTPQRLLNDLFCHDIDLLLNLIEECGYHATHQVESQAQLTSEGHLKIKMLITCSRVESSREGHKAPPHTSLSTQKLQISLQSIIGRGERRRSWCINQNYTYHLTHQNQVANPLYDQCNTVYHWSLSPQKPLPDPLCSIQKSMQRVRLLNHLAALMF